MHSPIGTKLEDGARADVCIIGAGIAGACIADELAREGRSIIMIDDGPVAGGETSRSTAHLTCALDDRFYILEQAHGSERARLAGQSHTAAIDRFEQVAAELDIGFSRLDGFLVMPEHRAAGDLLARELAAAQRAGIAVEAGPVRWGGFDWGPGLRFPGQGQIDPVAATRALIERAMGRGMALHLDTHILEVHGGDKAHVVTADGRVVHAAHIVVATNTPINDRVVIHTKQSAFRTYAIAIALEGGAPEPGLLWDGYWEGDRSYHYIRSAQLMGPEQPKPGWHLIVGGEDHKTGQDDGERPGHYEMLEDWVRSRLAGLGTISFRWSGQVMEPHDGVAFIGRNPADADNVYIITGDSGNGITHAAIAGMLIPDLIAGRDNPWAVLYEPSRKPVRSLGRFVRENINSAARYADWVRPGEVRSEEEIPRGCGAVLTQGVHKLAVYRELDGRVHRCSALCPHLGGVVHWNEVEGSWDCPLHGSRFDPQGRVVNGPANRNLAPSPALTEPAPSPAPP